MLCYNCGGTLGSGKFCLRCGADVTTYRKIVRLSNRYYNAGLEKAKARDLSGAVRDLTLSLQIDKRNIQARNLLGLVLYELGETVQALCEWVVSTHYQPENNLASGYVELLQNDRTQMDEASQSIRKFNIALDYAKKQSEDLAILQLEWVIAHHPKMAKAHALLALLYMWDEKYSKAEKEIRTVLKQDRGNSFCLNLADELAEKTHTPKMRAMETAGSAVRERIEAVSEETEKVRSALKGRPAFLLRVLLTALLLLAAFMGIILPTVQRRRSKAVSDAVAVYSERLEALRGELTDSQDLSEGYAILLQMEKLDPEVPEERAQLEQLFASLKRERSADELYQSKYLYWQGVLTKAPEESTEAVPPEETGASAAAENP